MIAMAVRPKVLNGSMFGLHRSSHPRVWTPREERLFHEIGRRLADALDTLLMVRDLLSKRELERSRAELAASRARVTAADQTRRRIERDLHDGVQQRLVSLVLQSGRRRRWSRRSIANCRRSCPGWGRTAGRAR